MSIFDRLKKPKTEDAPKKTSTKKASAAVVEATPAAEAPKKTKAAVSYKPTGHAHRVLVRPLLSEKSVRHEAMGTYTFVVVKTATKPAIKAAVEKVYGIRPVNVRIAHVDGKDVRFGNTMGRRNEWKKAMVTLPKGKSISIHEGV